jgi:RNA polymerase sigma-70 factor (sigma-E family)
MDRAEFAEFVAAHEASLLRYAYLLAGDRHEAEDLVQAAFLQMLRRLGTAVNSPGAYARRVVYHEYCSRGRRPRALLLLPGAPEESVPSFESDVDLRSWMWAELQCLPARQRAALVLRYYEGLPDGDIAVILGCRRSTVRSLVARSLAVLRERVRDVPVAAGLSAGRSA